MGWQDAPKVTPPQPQRQQPRQTQGGSWRTAPKAPQSRTWFDTAVEAVQNVPSSAIEFGKGIVQAVTNPLDTAGALLDLAAGTLNRAVPAPVREFVDKYDWNPEASARAVRTAQQVGGVYRQRYGSEEALKRTIAKDPVGAMADLSTLLTGGAGLVRGGAKATTRTAPRTSAALEKTANVLSTAGQATNPVNAMTRPAAVVPAMIRKTPIATQRFVSPKQTAYMEAAEGRAPDIIQKLRSSDIEMVPGSRPTAAQAASPLNITKFSALGASAEKALPTPYYERGLAQEAARVNAMRDIGKTPADLARGVAGREAASRPLYQAAEARKFRADPQFMQMADDPYIQQALPDAIKLSKSQGVTFRNNPVKFVHNIKISLDKMLTRTGDTALARGERAQVTGVKNRLVGWLESKAPEYGAARTTYAAKSKPINQMEVGQYLEGKLTAPLGVGERAGVFAGAVRDAAGTIKRATTGEARFKALTDILTPDQVRVVEAIRDDLARAAATKAQAKAGTPAAPKATQLASAAERGLRMPNLLNRVTALANDIMSRLRGKIDSKLAIQLATEMLDPAAAAAALEKAMIAEQRAARVGQAGAAAASAVGRAAKAPVTVAGERVQNAMAEYNNAPRQ